MSPRLTARTPIRDWLADPVGGPLFTAFLAQRGTDATRLGPISGYPIGEFVTLSQGTIDQEAIARSAHRSATPRLPRST